MAYTRDAPNSLLPLPRAVNVRMIDQGSSEINIIVGIENKDFEEAMRRILCFVPRQPSQNVKGEKKPLLGDRRMMDKLST